MKRKELETLEKINEERKLNKETREKIVKKALKNFGFATVILLFFIILKLIAINVDKQVTVLIYKISSIILFIFTIVLFEVAYEKDSDGLAMTSIEMWFLSIITLLTPYTLISRANVYTSSIGVFFVIYYAIKNFIIYINEKKEYLNEKSDIHEIVKKESQDKMAQEQLEKIRQEKIKQEKEENTPKPKRGRGRPRKTTNTETKTTTTKITKKITEKKEQNVTPPKRKRGRPKKVNN